MGRNPSNPDGVGRAIRVDDKLHMLRLRAGDIGGAALLTDDGAIYTDTDAGSMTLDLAGGPFDLTSNGGGISHDSGGGGHDIQTGGGGYEVDTGGGGYTIDTGDGGYEVDAASIRLELAADGNVSIEDTAADGIFFDGGPSSDSEINLWADHINLHSADITGLPSSGGSMARSFLLMGT